jgi:UDP-N-acetylglucosamine 2-epimerase (non-hydrolysing)
VKIATILGTRPEIIRLSQVIRLLDQAAEHVLVHTGQNYDDRLDGVFFRDLGVRAPDYNLGVRADTDAAQIGQIITRIEPVLLKERPDRVLLLGDTNSGLSAIVARRLGIPVYHMEAGNRCFDDRVPEEVNRRIIDHSSSVLLPYTNRSRENLLREGIASDRVYVTGNPITQVMDAYAHLIAESTALADLKVSAGQYFLATVHRAENVDREDTLRALLNAFDLVGRTYGMPVICSLHPRTKARLSRFDVNVQHGTLRMIEPVGFFDFVRLERSAFCVLSDSGTVQEETCILGIPMVTVREVTERPETLECGSNVLAGSDADFILRAVQLVTSQRGEWRPPAEYLRTNVAETVTRLLTGYRQRDYR